ncbi:MAG: hypothetical protein R2752_12315 [Vicinamibacterales bacterium]
MDRADGPDRGWAPTLAVASAGLTAFAIFIQSLVHSGHVDDIPSHTQTTIVPVLSIAAVLCGLGPVAPRAWRAFRCWAPDRYLTVTIPVLVLMGLGQWLGAAAAASLIAAWMALKRS